MPYFIDVEGSRFSVDSLEFGVLSGKSTGNIDLYITIEDSGGDIYETEEKKNFWTEWVDQCCGDKGKTETRIRKVIAKVTGGDANSETWRTITIEKGYIANYQEISNRGNPLLSEKTEYKYEVTIKAAPNKKGEVSVKAE